MKIDTNRDFGTRECPACASQVPANNNQCPICQYEFPAKHSAPYTIIAIVILLITVLLTGWIL